jgi:hypothetical protein
VPVTRFEHTAEFRAPLAPLAYKGAALKLMVAHGCALTLPPWSSTRSYRLR